MIEQAATLFQRQGYAATTIEQIASAAGVAVQTVYFHFGNKATVLKEVVDVLAVGDDEPVPMLQRPWVREMRETPDARRALALWLANSAMIFSRLAPVMKIVRDAAGSDPEMAAQWQTNAEQRFTAQRALAQRLADKGALRQGLSVERAADIIFCLVSHEVFALATTATGWTPAGWERWAFTTSESTVLLDR